MSNCSFGSLSNCSNMHIWSKSALTSNLDQKCAFQRFESGSKLQFKSKVESYYCKCIFDPLYNHVSKWHNGPLSNCSNMHFWSMFALTSNLDQKCAFQHFESGSRLQFCASSKILVRTFWNSFLSQNLYPQNLLYTIQFEILTII